MTALDDLRAVVELAATVDDRTPAEQRALLRLAVRCDREANSLTVANKRVGPAWRLYELVEAGQSVTLPDDERMKLGVRADAWDRFADQFRVSGITDEMREAGL